MSHENNKTPNLASSEGEKNMELVLKNRNLAKNSKGYCYLYISPIAVQFMDFPEKVNVVMTEQDGKKVLIIENAGVQ